MPWWGAFLVVALVATSLAGCRQNRGTTTKASRPKPFLLTILHTNDHHGHAWKWSRGKEAFGSLASRGALVARVRQEVTAAGGQLLLLDGGDINTGTFCSDSLQAEPDFVLYRRIGYHAAVLGNHDFDPPLEVLQRQAQWGGFPLLAANVVLRHTGEPAFKDVASWTLNGVRVSAIGFSPSRTPEISTRGNDPRLTFLDPVEVAAKRIPELRRDSRVVIVLAHFDLPDIQRLVKRTPGIDLVISGHDHRLLKAPMMVDDTPVVQAGSDGRYLGRIDLLVPAEGPVSVQRTTLYPITADVPEDPHLAATLKELEEKCGGDAVVGRAAQELRRFAPLAGVGSSTALGNLVADSLREATGADIAFVNRGGIRADLPAGPITRRLIHQLLPFDDTLVVFDVSGADLQQLAQELAQREPGGRGMLFPSGIDIVIRKGRRVDLRRGGRPVKPDARFTMVVSHFLARGGDGYKSFAGFRRLKSVPKSPKTAFTSYVAAHNPLRPSRAVRLRWEPGVAPAGRGTVGSPPH